MLTNTIYVLIHFEVELILSSCYLKKLTNETLLKKMFIDYKYQLKHVYSTIRIKYPHLSTLTNLKSYIAQDLLSNTALDSCATMKGDILRKVC